MLPGLTSKKGDQEKGIRIKPDLSIFFKNKGWHKLKSFGIGQSETNYSLVYGSGGDFIPANEE